MYFWMYLTHVPFTGNRPLIGRDLLFLPALRTNALKGIVNRVVSVDGPRIYEATVRPWHLTHLCFACMVNQPDGACMLTDMI
jgi:hypothetical protein